MQATEKIKISPALAESITKGDAERQNVLLQELGRHEKAIMNLLSSYHWEERGIVESLKIIEDSIKLDETGTGQFIVRYAINIHFGCSDRDIDLDKTMVIGVKLNLQANEALLTGEYIPEREPDDL